MAERGCKLVVYVEFVPVTEESKELAPDEAERTILKEGIARLRKECQEMVFVSFPGDEKGTDGCVLYEKRGAVEAVLSGGGK